MTEVYCIEELPPTSEAFLEGLPSGDFPKFVFKDKRLYIDESKVAKAEIYPCYIPDSGSWERNTIIDMTIPGCENVKTLFTDEIAKKLGIDINSGELKQWN